MTLQQFNQQDSNQIKEIFYNCCGSKKWATQMCKHSPYNTIKELIDTATDFWYNHCNEQDYLEAFAQHPKIGDVQSLKEKFAGTAHLNTAEQAGVNTATDEILEALAKGNDAYEQKFGFIFIVCATGRSALEMLRILMSRLHNHTDEELMVAMNEQHKITILRLKKLLFEEDWSSVQNSQITTHVLDTSVGKPAEGVAVSLKQWENDDWMVLSQGVTNADGRILDLLPPGKTLPAANYKIVFKTGAYFTAHETKGFYPEVEIQFTTTDDQHYHVPLLINPFGYSTYRGS